MLAQFIQKSEYTQASFAARLGISASYMSDIINGKKRPSLDLAFEIERETEGFVPASTWVTPKVRGFAEVDDGRGAAL